MYFSIFTLKFANFCNLYPIFPQKMPILTIFSQKSAILDNFLLLKVNNMGKFFHNFSAERGKIDFCGRIFTYIWMKMFLAMWTSLEGIL